MGRRNKKQILGGQKMNEAMKQDTYRMNQIRKGKKKFKHLNIAGQIEILDGIYGMTCRVCKKQYGNEVHHIVNRKHGKNDIRLNSWKNLSRLCKCCHTQLHTKGMHREFIKRKFEFNLEGE